MELLRSVKTVQATLAGSFRNGNKVYSLILCSSLSYMSVSRRKAANYVEQRQIGDEELALSQSHFGMLQALAANPESFSNQFAHPILQYTPEERAAVKLQSIWRGHACRTKLGLVRPYSVRHIRAAVQLQRIWRGYSTRSKSVYCARKITKQNAAISIQKV